MNGETMHFFSGDSSRTGCWKAAVTKRDDVDSDASGAYRCIDMQPVTVGVSRGRPGASTGG